MCSIGINGFGRIGRAFLRAAVHKNIPITAINNPGMTPEYMAYLFKYDTTHGVFRGPVCAENSCLIIKDQKIALSFEKNPENIKWKDMSVKYVAECSGLFITQDAASKHLKGGAKKIITSEPSEKVPTFISGVNLECYKPEINVLSNGSSTTNCLAPIAKILNENFEIIEGLMTSVRAVTTKNNIIDNLSKSWRLGRAGLSNIIPVHSGSAKAIDNIIPELKSKLDGVAFHVPVKNVSIIDLTVRLGKATTIDCIRHKIKEAAKESYKGIVGFTNEQLVSSDFNGTTYSAIFDSAASMGLNENFFKILAWYDNEYGSANRLLDLILHVISQEKEGQEKDGKEKK